MNTITNAPWHYQSFHAFMTEHLPVLLARKLPLASYLASEDDACKWTLRLCVHHPSGEICTTFQIPGCDRTGIFTIAAQQRVVVPVATCARLDEGEILCIGEQLLRVLDDRTSQAPTHLIADEDLLRKWLMLDDHIISFLTGRLNRDIEETFGWVTVQMLDSTNSLSRATHLRRILLPARKPGVEPSIPRRTQLVDSSERGRTCPFETPEGPNVGRVLSIAIGAQIIDRKLVIMDHSAAAGLGLTASTVPFLNHSDANRLLMGTNMMRQWVPLPDPEPALVQTGLEPGGADFWCGRNLLTAYMSLGTDTYEDAIILSESAARRLSPSAADAVIPGDKLSNRHGTKGVVSRILPDDQMPHTPDGMPVDIVFNFIGMHTRMNYGQTREGLVGLLARKHGIPAIIPPFTEPSDDELQRQLGNASGMAVLHDGKAGRPFQRPTLIGVVYWGLTIHRAAARIGTSPQSASFLQYQVLRELGAHQTIVELYSQSTGDGTPLRRLQDQLHDAGIRLSCDGGKLHFAFREATASDMTLATPLEHPWLPGHPLAFVAKGNRDVDFTNAQLTRLTQEKAPASLIARSRVALEQAVRRHFGALSDLGILRLSSRPAASGRAVIAPASNLQPDEIGIPQELADHLGLAQLPPGSCVLVNREPAVMPTSVLGLKPVVMPGKVIRLHPLHDPLLNADHDGDQITFFVVRSPDAQRELADTLSPAAHLRRDPSALRWVMPRQDMLLGLAWLSLTPDGRTPIARIAGTDLTGGNEFITAQSLQSALAAILRDQGPEQTLRICDALMRLGMDAIRATGMSLCPFAYRAMPAAGLIDPLTIENMRVYADSLTDQIISRTDYTSLEIGPQLFAIKTGARGNVNQLIAGMVSRTIMDYDGSLRHFQEALLSGLSPDATFTSYIGARIGIAECAFAPNSGTRQAYGLMEPAPAAGFHVLTRAMRSLKPEEVFARAAAAGEADPLTDLDARLFAGIAE